MNDAERLQVTAKNTISQSHPKKIKEKKRTLCITHIPKYPLQALELASVDIEDRLLRLVRLVVLPPRFSFLSLVATCFAGHPLYMAPASATSPEVSRECSHSVLPSSMDAPDNSRDPFRIAHLHKPKKEDKQGHDQYFLIQTKRERM